MKPILWALLAGLIAGGIGYYTGARISSAKASEKIQALQVQAAEAKGAEDELKAGQIREAKLDVYAANQRAMAAGSEIDRLKAKLASLHKPAASTLPLVPPVVAVVGGPSESVVAVQSELIAAQDVKIIALEDGITARDKQIDGLEKALRLADLRADLQAQASKAALAGLKKGRWLGRIEGFAVGAALGYAGGRLR